MEVRLPLSDPPAGVHRDQSFLPEERVRLKHLFERQESMVGHDGDHDIAAAERGHDLLDEPVEPLDGLERLRAARTSVVLRIVQIDEVHEHEVRAVGLADERRDLGRILVGEWPGKRRATTRLHGFDQVRCREGTNQRQVLGMRRADVFGKEQIRWRPDSDGPHDRRRPQARPSSRAQERDRPDVARIPVPGTHRPIFGIDESVVDDAVQRRTNAGDECGVRGKRHRGQHADDAARPGAFAGEPSERRDLRWPWGGIHHRHHAVDRDHEDPGRILSHDRHRRQRSSRENQSEEAVLHHAENYRRVQSRRCDESVICGFRIVQWCRAHPTRWQMGTPSPVASSRRRHLREGHAWRRPWPRAFDARRSVVQSRW